SSGVCAAAASSLVCSSVVPSSAFSSSVVGSSCSSGLSGSGAGASSCPSCSVSSGGLTPFAAAAGGGSKRTQPCSGPNHTSGQACAFFALTVHSSPSCSPGVKPMTTRVG